MDFFFDNQLKRYLLQFMRIFSDIKVRNGPDASGIYTIQRVPIMYGDPSKMVAQLIKGASENTLLPTPMFSAYIDSIKLAPDRRQDTMHVGKLSTMERRYDRNTGLYTNEPGVRQDIERYMPVPYDMYCKLDVWTSNITTKLQLFEQIGIIFNPSIQLQQNANLLDWTSIFEVFIEDYTWTNRSVPQGSDDTRDIMSFKFKIPIWLNPPAKLKRSSLIAEIVTNVFESSDIQDISAKIDGLYDPFNTMSNPTQIITTVGNHRIKVEKGPTSDIITLLTESGLVNADISWQSLIQKYGVITQNITKIRLKLDPDIESTSKDIIGNIALDPVHKNVLLFYPDIDTLPATTLRPIIDIIDPTEHSPGDGLPAPVYGQRYLLTSANAYPDEVALPVVHTSPWGILVAYPNDIIEYDGSRWIVAFDSSEAVGQQYVINNKDGAQYMYTNGNWSYAYYGKYNAGYWRIDNIVIMQDNAKIDIYE